MFLPGPTWLSYPVSRTASAAQSCTDFTDSTGGEGACLGHVTYFSQNPRNEGPGENSKHLQPTFVLEID